MSNQLFLQLWVRARSVYTERGATAVEYGLIVALIAAVIIGLLGAIGASTGFGFGSYNDSFEQYNQQN